MEEIEPLRVQPIKNGTVIDHIPSGRSIKVLKVLGLYDRIQKDYENIVSVLSRVPSEKYGTKDILKLEDLELSKTDVNKLVLIAPNASVNLIRGFTVAEKLEIELPEMLENIVQCPNIGKNGCITNSTTVQGHREPITYGIKVLDKNPLTLMCYYCEKIFTEEDYSINNLIL